MIIVMTGGTSGIGAEALNKIRENEDNTVFVGARHGNRTLQNGARALTLDLSSLESVRAFAENIQQSIQPHKIDLLILNAGVQAGNNSEVNADGINLTFAINHLSHYLLIRLLLPYIAKDGRILITTSDAHDAQIIPFGPKTMDIHKLAFPDESSPKGMAFYAATKLCNILTADTLHHSVLSHANIQVIAYNPGLTGDTGLMGKQTGLLKIAVKVVRPIFRFLSLFNPMFYMNTAKKSGEILAGLALGNIKLPKGSMYASVVRGKVTFPSPAVLVKDENLKRDLWTKSAKMVNLSAETVL
ncbi:SDR family NAD(P)-dependent oxidoreductase [Sphingobacterium bambusae]|uniref:SDR family NAD(P)-dependent oxidoreductase n=1 Tax=Sphingobacterium bambusae TaxID=662858 RepID=A0ABW6BMS1_9SPHI|nr:SDR family NAD(P)-dependent oxidoreductase [Sphingobacterium bambusae]WPL51012.1 SDR family NAD(P)-dependent oxidoreductase [Sphingobacterium bambusae]